MKFYYLYCKKCGIVTGKILGFGKIKKTQKNHELQHKLKKERWDYTCIMDWGKTWK